MPQVALASVLLLIGTQRSRCEQPEPQRLWRLCWNSQVYNISSICDSVRSRVTASKVTPGLISARERDRPCAELIGLCVSSKLTSSILGTLAPMCTRENQVRSPMRRDGIYSQRSLLARNVGARKDRLQHRVAKIAPRKKPADFCLGASC